MTKKFRRLSPCKLRFANRLTTFVVSFSNGKRHWPPPPMPQSAENSSFKTWNGKIEKSLQTVSRRLFLHLIHFLSHHSISASASSAGYFAESISDSLPAPHSLMSRRVPGVDLRSQHHTDFLQPQQFCLFHYCFLLVCIPHTDYTSLRHDILISLSLDKPTLIFQ